MPNNEKADQIMDGSHTNKHTQTHFTTQYELNFGLKSEC